MRNWLGGIVLGVALCALGVLLLVRPRAEVLETSAAESWNGALEALERGEFQRAEEQAETAVLDGGAVFVGRRDFLFGYTSFLRAVAAEQLAARPEAGPPALDAAILEARRAAAYWLAAARSRDDWPAARRNLQRALEKVVYLEARRDLMRDQARKEKPGERPIEEEPEKGMPLEEEVAIEIESGELGRAAFDRLLDLLAAKEREKLELRRKRLAERSARGGRDW